MPETMTVALGYQNSCPDGSPIFAATVSAARSSGFTFVPEQFVVNSDLIQETSGVGVPCQGAPVLERIPADINQFLGGRPR